MRAKLYRAVAMSRLKNDAAHVFFEHDIWHSPAETRLIQLLSQMWDVPAMDLYITGLRSEDELIRAAQGSPLTGEARLFENGRVDGAIHYMQRDHTLMLVTPKTLRRLLAAQARLPEPARTPA